MKSTIIALYFITLVNGVGAQNLISNWNFQYDNLGMNCEDWYNPCGAEISTNCSENFICQTAIFDGSPSDIPEDLWSLIIDAGFPEEGYAETYITGQNGTYVYQFNCWIRAVNGRFFGQAILGTGAHSQFVASKSAGNSSETWTEISFIDTLTTTVDDSITVRLWAGVGDFCACQSAYDFIELTVIDSLIVTSTDQSMTQNESRVFPNPARDFVTIEIVQPDQGMRIWTVYDGTGVVVDRVETVNTSWNIDITSYKKGIYFFHVQQVGNLIKTASGKFVKE